MSHVPSLRHKLVQLSKNDRNYYLFELHETETQCKSCERHEMCSYLLGLEMVVLDK